MELVQRFPRGPLRRPAAVMAFEGWNDASEAATGALAFLLGQFEAEPFAVIQPEEFFNFPARRPLVEVDEGGTRQLTWPLTKCFGLAMPEQGRDLVAVIGEEPHLRWQTFSRTLLDILREAEVEEVVLLGAFIGQVAHTLPVPIVGVATDPTLVQQHGLLASRYEGPTGIIGVLMESFREAGLRAISLWAAIPHYLAANPNPKAMLALLTKAGEILEMRVDATELATVAGEFESRVNAAMQESQDFAQYVQRLESSPSDLQHLDPEAGRQLVQEVEEFLREHGV
ncbi:MAG: PAC2 family protein [Actinomycetota bacterium]|nr:PAC2 family protein [Actinomycetota bacterium]